MSDTLQEQLENLSLLAVMLDPRDIQGFEMIYVLLEDLAKIAGDTGGVERVKASCSWLLKEKEVRGTEEMSQLINDFITAMQGFLKDPNGVSFPNEQEKSSWGKDLSPQADNELIVEFVEKHTSLLDDYEAALLELSNESSQQADDIEQFRTYIKGYLHNLKGDAGSVGLLGIERATHYLEDRLNEVAPENCVQELLDYREWVLSVMESYVKEEPPSVTSDAYVEKLQQRYSSETSATIEVEVVGTQQEESQEDCIFEEYEISGDAEILYEFLAEAEEHLTIIENLLLDKETGFNSDDVDTVFRAMHSIKGGSSYFNLQEITKTSHVAENLLDKARNGLILFNGALKSLVLSYIDVERELMESAKGALSGTRKISPLNASSQFIALINDYLHAISIVEGIDVIELALDEFEINDDDSVAKLEHSPPSSDVSQVVQSLNKNAPASISRSSKSKTQSSSKRKGAVDTKKTEVKSFVKIETKRLDHLLEYIGEMVISSSMLIKNCRDLLSENEDVINNSNQLERISREIQEIGMSMRLIPIKGLFQKMSRVVWDTAKKLNKDIRFEMEGEDTELDRTVIDRLADPLMHMVRNAVDHGVESSDERSQTEKTPQGLVRISASHSNGNIVIQIEDDGKGLDPEKLISIARDRGIVDDTQVLTDEEAYMLIFAAGFSTAEVVTDVSGRGVGMDVVRRNIESMRGRVRIQSELGKGSTFTIELPLTLAIMEGIETAVGNERFIIPSLSIVEFLRPTEEMITHTLGRGETVQFRGSFLPVFHVSELYGIRPHYSSATEGIMVIVDNGNKLVALLVDEVLGKFSAVIKSLGNLFREVEGVSGCAIMPDGSIGLVLDVLSLVTLGEASVRNLVEKTPKLPGAETLTKVVKRGERIH